MLWEILIYHSLVAWHIVFGVVVVVVGPIHPSRTQVHELFRIELCVRW